MLPHGSSWRYTHLDNEIKKITDVIWGQSGSAVGRSKDDVVRLVLELLYIVDRGLKGADNVIDVGRQVFWCRSFGGGRTCIIISKLSQQA